MEMTRCFSKLAIELLQDRDLKEPKYVIAIRIKKLLFTYFPNNL